MYTMHESSWEGITYICLNIHQVSKTKPLWKATQETNSAL